MANNKPVEIVKNNNGVFLLYSGSSIQDQLNELQNIKMSIKDNPNYSEEEKERILDTVQHDSRNLYEVQKRSS